MTAADGRSATPSTIRVENLEKLPSVFQDAFNAGDLDGLVSLYEPAAVFVPAPGQAAVGSAFIREALAGFLAVKGRFELELKTRQQVGDIALGILEWRLESTDLDGNPVKFGGLAAAVLHRASDGRWLVVIDNPFLFGDEAPTWSWPQPTPGSPGRPGCTQPMSAGGPRSSFCYG